MSPSYSELIKHYEDIGNALLHYFNSIITEQVIDDAYVGYSQKDIETILSKRIDEAEVQACLMLLVAIEGFVRTACKERLSSGFQNKCLEKEIEKIYLRKGEPSISELLDAWGRYLPCSQKTAVKNFKGALKFRNWIAHGRHVPYPIRPVFCDIKSIFDLAQNLERILSSH